MSFEEVNWYEGYPGYAVEDIVTREHNTEYGAGIFRTAVLAAGEAPSYKMDKDWRIINYYTYPDGTIEAVYEKWPGDNRE